jgi:hypothetical protein
MSKETTLDHLVASYFVQGVCSNKQADIPPGCRPKSIRDFAPRGKAYQRIADIEVAGRKPGEGQVRGGCRSAIEHLKTLKREKWEAKWAAKYEQQLKNWKAKHAPYMSSK